MNRSTIIDEIKKNAINYFLIVFVLVIAIVSGFVVANNINSRTENSISKYLFSAFEYLKTQNVNIDSTTILYNIILQNIIVFGIIIVLGIIRFGFVFVYFVILFKGVVLGFTCNIIINAFSFLNSVKVISILLPSLLIFVFVLIRCVCKAVSYSFTKSFISNSIINYDNPTMNIRLYCFCQLKCVFPLLLACLWDSFVVVWILT